MGKKVITAVKKTYFNTSELLLIIVINNDKTIGKLNLTYFFNITKNLSYEKRTYVKTLGN